MAKIPVVSTIPVAKCFKHNSGTRTLLLALRMHGLFMDFGEPVLLHIDMRMDGLTLHRPDHCAGGFDQFCDSKRKYSNISLILIDSGRGDLLEYMSEYWKDFRGDDANLWEHEWNKHGTCVSTLETNCYEDYLPQQEVVDYFDKTVEIYKELPSHEVGVAPRRD
jgi:hypothetical protein